jgi:hypothetical protein
VPWLLGKQHAVLAGMPSVAAPKQLDKKPTDVALLPQPPVLPARHSLNAMSLRQMSKDLGAVAAGSKVPDAMLSAVATLGLPTPVVARTRMDRKTTIEQAIASTSASDEDEKEVRAADKVIKQ